MKLSENEQKIVDQISEITSKQSVGPEDIIEAKRLINTLPDEIARMYDEAFFLIDDDKTQ